MAKKKRIDLTNKNLHFTGGGVHYQLLSFDPNNMTLQTLRLENDILMDEFTLPFAHLPKALKKIIKPT